MVYTVVSLCWRHFGVLLLFFLLFDISFRHLGNAQRTEFMRQSFLQQFRTSVPSAGYVRNYVGDPEADMTVPQIIKHWNYPVETHQALTPDGYILELHRIPAGRYGKQKSHRRGQKPAIFLQHGLLCTSSVWVMNLPHQSAAFLFADAGFDVWMGNMRGNSYSRGHLQKNISPDQYWSFSWDEMARYDLEAMINYVLNTTKQAQIYYVGHSQGTLTMFSKLSLNDGFNKKIKKFFAIAPVGTIAHVKGLFRYLGDRMYDQLTLFKTFFGDQEFLPNTFLSRFLTEFVCGLSTRNPLCENFMFLVSGPDSMQLNKTRIGIYLAHNPAGTSLRNILHYCQMVRHGRQQAFDYGRNGNIKHYGMVIAPEYLISEIDNVPIHLYYSDTDWLATSADIERHLLKWLKPWTLAGVHKLVDFNHNDFLWGLRAADEVYWPIIQEIQRENRPETIFKKFETDSNAVATAAAAAAGAATFSSSKKSIEISRESEEIENKESLKTLAPPFSFSLTDDFDLFPPKNSTTVPKISENLKVEDMDLIRSKTRR